MFCLQSRTARGVRRDRDYRWPNGIVYYDFNQSIDSSSQRIIQYAIDVLERETCLRFQLRTFGDRIWFTNGSGCSSYVGRQGKGEQAVTLGKGCYSVGIILHEILHALGMWHEHSRPDRDDYIRIISSNIKEDYRYAFQKRNSFLIDYYGEGYDYASIMHYGLSAFSRSSELRTIEVTNDAEYIWQGQPIVGQRKTLSVSDIIQINRMYNCRGSGVPGRLQVLIRNAINLITNGLPPASPRVYITAVDDKGSNVTKFTNVIHITSWNELLDFGGRMSWQYMTISVWSVNSQLIKNQVFSLSSGSHKNLHHCSDSHCSTFVRFDYSLRLDSDECNPNPCRNGGTCRDLISSFLCDCPAGYSGHQCQHAKGRLRVYIRNATDLPRQADGELPSSYVAVYAYALNDSRVSQATHATRSTLSPRWNYNMDFGVGEWFRIYVRIYDWDGSNATPLSKWTSYFLSSHTSQTVVKMEADSGYVLFDYHFKK